MNSEKNEAASSNRVELWWNRNKRYFLLWRKLIFLLGLILFILLILELGSLVVLKLFLGTHSGAQDQRLDLNVFQDQLWAQNYFKEFQEASVFEYTPYLDFKRRPNYHGTYVNLDDRSVRKTVSSCGKYNTSYRIFAFGGSTLWGSGARDEGTIASQLATELCDQGFAVEVTNFGESAYVNTQEVIRLMLELRQGNIPDIVIFYDGFNEVYSSFQNQAAGLPQNIINRRKEFNLLKKFYPLGLTPHFNEIMQRITVKLVKQNYPPLNGALVEETSQIYLQNQQIAAALSQQFQFKAFFYWQPTIFTKKLKSQEEQKIALGSYLPQSFVEVTAKVVENHNTIDLTAIFEEHPETIYIDWSHISEQGNSLVATEIAKDVKQYLATK